MLRSEHIPTILTLSTLLPRSHPDSIENWFFPQRESLAHTTSKSREVVTASTARPRSPNKAEKNLSLHLSTLLPIICSRSTAHCLISPPERERRRKEGWGGEYGLLSTSNKILAKIPISLERSCAPAWISSDPGCILLRVCKAFFTCIILMLPYNNSTEVGGEDIIIIPFYRRKN